MTIDSPPSLGRRWRIFIGERFPLAAHLPMAAVFALANMGLAARAGGQGIDIVRAMLGMLLALSFLFRLRCFDEIKDYATDLQVNPERPLPRGVLTLRQVKTAIVVLAVFELIIAASAGWPILATHLLAVGYSFLMYREFFIGKFLRPRLTAYAVTHTFVSILLGWSLASLATGLLVVKLPLPELLFGLANWMLFNVFEFARKSWAPAEEAPGVDSYSSLYHPWGAAALTISQVAMALGVLWRLPMRTPVIIESVAGGVLALVTLAYAVHPQPVTAKVYRNAASVYILAFYLILAIGIYF